MNKLVKSVAMGLAASSLLASTGAMAKELKIAVANIQAIYAQAPQTASFQESLKSEFKTQIDAFEQLQGDLKYNLEKQKRDAAIMSKKDMDALQETIDKQGAEFQQKRAELQQTMARRENEERNKVLALIQTAINEVAEKDGYDLVLQPSGLAYAKPEFNISEKVLEKVSKQK